MNKIDFSVNVRLATIFKLAKRLNKEHFEEACHEAEEYFETDWNGLIGSNLETCADIPQEVLKSDGKLRELCIDVYTNGIYRGYLAGISAMEKLLLFCDELIENKDLTINEMGSDTDTQMEKPLQCANTARAGR